MMSSDRKLLEWLEPERLCEELPKRKKHTGLYWWLITLLFFNYFFVYCWGVVISVVRLYSTWEWAGAAEAPHWELSAFEDVGQTPWDIVHTGYILL